MRKIPGYNYRTHQAVDLTRAQWQALMVGNRRRFDGQVGETFIHEGGGPKLIAEAYANIQAPRVRPEGL